MHVTPPPFFHKKTVFFLVAPVFTVFCFLAGWEFLVGWYEIPPWLLPAPSRIGQSFMRDWPILQRSFLVTFSLAFAALLLAAVTGAICAILFSLSRFLEAAILPVAVILQVTPLIALAPLFAIYFTHPLPKLLLCAWLVAFFPILLNSSLGLRAVDEKLLALFTLHQASSWQKFWYLRLPNALPHFMAGLRIAAGLALIGAVVGEFVVGTGGWRWGPGLAARMLEASYRLQIDKMFAILFLLCLLGLFLYGVCGCLSHLLLRRWHESAR